MADNITAPATGTVFATDDISGVHYPITKLAFGAADSATQVADANGARLPVAIGGTLPAFAATPTVNIGTAPTIAVTGPLTDAQLRASAIAVSFTGQSVGITGTVAVTGPLTDAQLRASAVPVTLAPIDRPIAEPTFAGTRVAVTASASGGSLPALGASRRIRVMASTRCFLRTGTVTNNAGTDGNSLAIAADAEVSFIVPAGHTSFSVVRDSADGFISIMPWAN